MTLRPKEASTPAPVAQEKPLIAQPFLCGNAFGDHHPGCPAYGPCEYEAGYRRKYGHPPLEPIAPEHRKSRSVAKEDPKPPELEEPAIVQELHEAFALVVDGSTRKVVRGFDFSRPQYEQLLRFIDSRKATVSERERELESKLTVAARLMCDWALEREQWRTELKSRTAIAEKCVDAEQERDRLREELSALKARPVVDIKPFLCTLRETLINELAAVAGWGQDRATTLVDACGLRANAAHILESLQPASAKADEKCERCAGYGYYGSVGLEVSCGACNGSGRRWPST